MFILASVSFLQPIQEDVSGSDLSGNHSRNGDLAVLLNHIKYIRDDYSEARPKKSPRKQVMDALLEILVYLHAKARSVFS
jgi:hypothetical protein